MFTGTTKTPFSQILLLVLLAAAVAPFTLTLGHALVWDDHYIIGHVRELAGRGGLASVLSAPFLPQEGTADAYYRPLVYGSFWFDSRLARGDSSFPYHLTNVLLHAAVALLVALLGRRVTGNWTSGFAAGLLFAVHPTRTESVAFVSGRTDIWAGFFALCALLAALARDETSDRFRRGMLLGLGCCSVAAACLSKETAFALPGILVVLALLAPTDRARPWGAAIAYALTAAAIFAVRSLVLGSAAAGHPAPAAPLIVQDPAAAFSALVKMLRMVLVPWPHNALIGREHLALNAIDVIAAGALVAGMVALGTRRCGRIGLLGLAWLLAFLLPALLVPSSSEILAAERYLYLPSIGVFLALGHAAGTGIDALSPAPRPLAWRALACVAAALGAGALVRSTVWRNDLTLSTDLARTAPNTALAHSALGQALLAAERYPEALASFRRAVELSPNDAGAHNDLGIALRRLRQPGLAAAAFRQSLRLDPTRSGPRLNLAYACLMLRDFGCVAEQRAILAASDPVALQQLDSVLADGR